MSRLHEPIQQHIHGDLCTEVNEMIIRLKIHSDSHRHEQSAEQQAKIMEARKRHPEVTPNEMIDLLTRVRDEMDQCKQPFKRYC